MMTVSVHFVEKHDGWDDDYDVVHVGFFEQGWRWTQIGLDGHVFKTWKAFFSTIPKSNFGDDDEHNPCKKWWWWGWWWTQIGLDSHVFTTSSRAK